MPEDLIAAEIAVRSLHPSGHTIASRPFETDPWQDRVMVELPRWITGLGCVILLSAAAPCAAQACGPGEAEAMRLTREAHTAFREAHYERARALLDRALELCEQPIIVFNLARVSLETGELRAAQRHYRRYLEMRTDAPDRPEVERRLASIEDEIAALDRLEQDARRAARDAQRAREEAEAAHARAARVESREQVGPWAVGAGGIVVLGAGLGFAVAAQIQSDVPADLDHLAASASLRQAELFALLANISFGVGAAAVLAAGLWGLVVVLDATDDGGEARLYLRADRVVFEGRF